MIPSPSYTPLMQQYHDIKSDYTDALLLFQVGDFYELFYDDAKKAAAFLGITLTSRGKNNGEPIPLCGVPVHTKDHYIAKLVKGGFNVALCDQLEPAIPGVVVKRGVTQVLTPGTLVEGLLLDEKKASYLFSCFPSANGCGLLFGELLTAQLFATTLPLSADRSLESELSRFFPDEILIPNSPQGRQYAARFKQWGYCTTVIDRVQEHDQPTRDAADIWVTQQFDREVMSALAASEALRCALYYFYAYMSKNQHASLNQFRTFTLYKPDDFLMIDAATQRNLELIKNNQDSTTKNTLFALLDRAQTPMGSRLLRKWIVRPLISLPAIVQRQDVVTLFMNNRQYAESVRDYLASIGDIERIIGRIALDRASVHDYVALKKALETVPLLAATLEPYSDWILIQIVLQSCTSFDVLVDLLEQSINDDISKPWLIKKGFDTDLDAMRNLIMHSTEKLMELECAEQERTGITSLKVRYNQVHGYYIEVTNANLAMIPDYYMRRQTLVGKERFITSDLQKLEYDIERARTDIDAREAVLFALVKERTRAYVGPLRKLAYTLSNLDALLSLALVAQDTIYVRPLFNTARDIIITEGRHPVVEAVVSGQFIANNTELTDAQSLMILTGPNMGGKSTYLRQVALISIMAQIGSFVPAQSASLPLLDRIFTRIGAGDNLAEGKSTFLIEMEETATICTQATANSLVILDEVGRGTSTFDGLAIAQAVVEHIFMRIGARCLFATHYHELTALQEVHTGIVSFYAASTKTADGIVFLYKIIRGIADGSFGIEVGRLAQLPDSVIVRAREVLQELKAQGITQTLCSSDQNLLQQENERLRQQALLFESARVLQGKLAQIDYNELSPKQAFDLLWGLKDLQ
jgi:DNA mismatch repair protein MutS